MPTKTSAEAPSNPTQLPLQTPSTFPQAGAPLPPGKIRIGHLVSHPIQYFAPLYREVAKREDLSLTVHFYSGITAQAYFDPGFNRTVHWDIPLLDGYASCLYKGSALRPVADGFDWRPNWPLLRDVLRKRYDVIWIHGYAFLNAWIIVLLSAFTKTPVLLRDEQTLLSPLSSLKRTVKSWVMPIILRRVNALYLGSSNLAFFKHYGTRRFFNVKYSVDNDYLRTRYQQLRSSRPSLRKHFGIEDEHPVILFSGKLIDKKQPQLLLEAFRLVRATTPCHLLFVGDGELRPMLEEKVKSGNIPDVRFAGFLNQTELPQAYTAADIFVLPSAYQETWGLVVNEAMNFSLPLVLSSNVGSAADLVRPGENGFVFPSGNLEQFTAALAQLVNSEETRTAFGAKSAELVSTYTYSSCADGIVAACKAVVTRKP